MSTQKSELTQYLIVIILATISALPSVQAEEVLWAPRSEGDLVKDLSAILSKLEIKASSAEEHLKDWLASPAAAHLNAERLDLLKREITQLEPSAPVDLALKVCHARSLETKGESARALNLYEEVFRAPLGKEVLKPQLSNAFTFYPIQVYAKHIAASQLCRAGTSSEAKSGLACAFAGIYQTIDIELIESAQECATHQTREHCELPLQKILEFIFLGEKAFPSSFRRQLCSGSIHTRPVEDKIICTTISAVLPIASATRKIAGLSHMTPDSLAPYSDTLLNPHLKDASSRATGCLPNTTIGDSSPCSLMSATRKRLKARLIIAWQQPIRHSQLTSRRLGIKHVISSRDLKCGH